MTLDIVKMQAIAEETHAVAALKCFGPPGTQALRSLVEMLIRLYKNIELTGRTPPLALFVRPKLDNPFEPADGAIAPLHRLSDPQNIRHELDAACIVEVTGSGVLDVFGCEHFVLEDLSSEAIIYIYHKGVERFIIDRVSYRIINPASTHASVFARPTFSSLNEALEDYRVRVVRDTSCFILADAWSDSKRLFLRTKPEATMRRSLHQHLRTVFRDAEVRPEQVVDESHPVDLKVTWSDTNQRALIEIKWLGQSRGDSGQFATSYTAARAREGAKQLADYLDADRSAGPGLRTKGYLVVFDARRRGLTQETTSLCAADGLHYRDAAIEYDPPYHETRDDFEPPIRLFAEPVLN